MKRHNQAIKEKKQDDTQIVKLSNTVVETSAKLDEQQMVNAKLTEDLKSTSQSLLSASNQSVVLSADLAKSKAEAQDNFEAFKAAEAENSKRQARIDELGKQIDNQTSQLTGLNTQIESLNTLISNTERQLSASEGDRAFLLTELKRLQTEKADLERKFNDLAMLRSQISKLKEELSIARRIDWIRSGLYGSAERKGAEKLLLGVTPSPKPRPGFDLNVELRQDGAATVGTNQAAQPK